MHKMYKGPPAGEPLRIRRASVSGKTSTVKCDAQLDRALPGIPGPQHLHSGPRSPRGASSGRRASSGTDEDCNEHQPSDGPQDRELGTPNTNWSPTAHTPPHVDLFWILGKS